MNSSDHSQLLYQLLMLRIHVAYLGESHVHAWWSTSFFSPTAKAFLDPIYARTQLLAQYHGAIEAAVLEHDEHLSESTFHLFRLPEEIEADFSDAVRSMGADRFYPRGKEISLETLRQLSGDQLASAEGPVSIGSLADLSKPSTVSAFAAAYFGGFSNGYRTYPYLVRQ